MTRHNLYSRFFTFLCATLVLSSFIGNKSAFACSAEPMIGTMCLFVGSTVPKGYVIPQGQILKISEYPTLYSILGSSYGGDGHTTFALPDLRGRVVIGAGEGEGLPLYKIGEKGNLSGHVKGKEALTDTPFITINWILAINGVSPNSLKRTKINK